MRRQQRLLLSVTMRHLGLWYLVLMSILVTHVIGDPHDNGNTIGDATQTIFAQRLVCGEEHVDHPLSTQRNVSTGRVKYSWRFGLFRLHYKLDLRVRRAAAAACRSLQNVVLELLEGISVDIARSRLASIATRASRELGQVPRHDAIYKEVVVYDGRSLREITDELIRHYVYFMWEFAGMDQEQRVKLADQALKDLLWSLYLSQILAGFFSCLELVPMSTDARKGAGTASDQYCASRESAGRNYGIGYRYFFETGSEQRFGHMLHLLQASGVVAPRLLEVGVDTGAMPAFVLGRDPDVLYVGVDTYNSKAYGDPEEIFHGTAALLGRYGDRARLFKGTLSDFLNQAFNDAQGFHVGFIDGDHSFDGVQADLKLAPKLIEPGGILAGHDFTAWHFDIMVAVFIAMKDLNVQNLYLGTDHTWWMRVPK
eukprot:TRINITY_DN74543_c0_g1_i1.p1 TRINITY_DN74543_c0_g1~~TRINITY_DN74543_c0_g1_i1.p1  ORF type:complete len:426 (+),score=58.91 TRINITY_DN74543_c0_g1_i1:256-1533(+)